MSLEFIYLVFSLTFSLHINNTSQPQVQVNTEAGVVHAVVADDLGHICYHFDRDMLVFIDIYRYYS